MRRYCRYLGMVTLGIAHLSCADANDSEGAGSRQVAAAVASAGAPLSARTNVHSPAPVLMSRPPGTPTSTVAAPIPTVFPSQVPPFIPVVTVAATTPPNGPNLPLGPGIQLPQTAATVTCKAAPNLALNCPPEAPTASTCTSRENLPSGCQSKNIPGVLNPPRAYPACCS